MKTREARKLEAIVLTALPFLQERKSGENFRNRKIRCFRLLSEILPEEKE